MNRREGENKYVVTKNNPYSPSVEYFETIEEAREQRDEWVYGNAYADGDIEVKITVALVVETVEIKTFY